MRCMEISNARWYEAKAMLDVVFIAATVGFFVIALAYVYACERLRGGKDER